MSDNVQPTNEAASEETVTLTVIPESGDPAEQAELTRDLADHLRAAGIPVTIIRQVTGLDLDDEETGETITDPVE